MTMPGAGQEQAHKWKVVRVQPESHDTNSLFLEGNDEKFLQRKAGQYASIRIMRPDGWSEPHPFTISCAPEDSQLRFTIKKIGNFTSAIPDLKPGTPVKCMGPLGVFCKEIDARPSIVMIAGGVGITPFLSVLRHFRNTGVGNEVKLFWSNKTIDDVICLGEINEMTKALKLRVIHSLSRDDDATMHEQPLFPNVFYEPGRLSAGILGKHGVSAGAAFYLCGPPPMMDSTLQELSSLGVDPETVEREKFSWK